MRISLFILLITLISCSTTTNNDPLKNTKSLMAKGHTSLYENGAFTVPYTQVKLIAPGPDAWDLTQNLAGVKAKEALLLAIMDVKGSYGLIKKGTLESLKLSKKIYKTGSNLSGKVHRTTVDDSWYLIKKSAALPKDITLSSIKLTKKTVRALKDLSERMDKASLEFGNEAKSEFIRGSQVLAFNLEEGGAHLSRDMNELGDDIDQPTLEPKKNNKDIYARLARGGEQASESLKRFSKFIYKKTKKVSKKHLAFAKGHFVKGWIAFPKKVQRRREDYSFDNFKKAFQSSEEIRKEYSDKMTYVIRSTATDYTSDVGHSLSKAKEEITEGTTTMGITLSAAKSLAWLTKAIFWDATIKPLGKTTGAALGYLTLNSVLYPSLIIGNTIAATSEIAVKFTWNTIETVYDFTAPTVVSGMAAALSLLEYTGGSLVAGGVYASAPLSEYYLKGTGRVAEGGAYVGDKASKSLTYVGKKIAKGTLKGSALIVKGTSKVGAATIRGTGVVGGNIVSVTSKGVGKAASLTTHYVGVPIAATGIPVTGALTGVAVGTAGMATGATYYGVGETLSGATYVAGTTMAGTTAVVGTVGSVVAGTAVSAYEVMKGVTVPSGYALGGGVVLTYGTLTQLSAQTILAASDVAYLVLSLEGPKWVLYGVTGKLNDGSNLAGGTVLDLEKMQTEGEEIKRIPVSDEEMQRVLRSFEGESR